jgi:hypothetical protein
MKRSEEFKMAFGNTPARKHFSWLAAICLCFTAGSSFLILVAQAHAAQQPSGQTSAPARPRGTIKSISGNTITLSTDAGSEVTVVVQDGAKVVRIAPGQTDLKDAAPLQLQDLQPNDRILVRGNLAADGKSVLALSIIAMKNADIAEKQAREREEWQKHGTGGLVSSVDAASSTVTVSLPAIGEKKNMAIHLSKDTILRRYAPDSVKFDDAKLAPLDQIKPGDQLRARGTRSADGSELAAVEIVSGSFRNIAGTISSIDASAGSITVQDLATKKSATIKITSDSQLRKLQPAMAQRIAARLKGIPADASSQGAPNAPAGATAGQTPRPGGPAAGGPGANGAGGQGRPGGGGSGDLQQAITRMPAATLADLQKGDAVMIVATEGGPNAMPSAITLLAGVEPILQASPNSSASTILSPWSLAGAPGGEGATP